MDSKTNMLCLLTDKVDEINKEIATLFPLLEPLKACYIDAYTKYMGVKNKIDYLKEKVYRLDVERCNLSRKLNQDTKRKHVKKVARGTNKGKKVDLMALFQGMDEGEKQRIIAMLERQLNKV